MININYKDNRESNQSNKLSFFISKIKSDEATVCKKRVSNLIHTKFFEILLRKRERVSLIITSLADLTLTVLFTFTLFEESL